MKISFFIGSMRRGGAERVISILANAYAEKGWDVEIALLLEHEVGYEHHPSIRIVDLSKGHGGRLGKVPSWLCNIRTYVKTSRPDRIVSFVGRINALVLTACFGLKIPIVVSERNDPKHDGRSGFMLWYCNQLYKQAAAIVYQTAYEMSCFAPSLKEKGCIVPNPVSVSAQPQTPVALRIVTAGRLQPQKNQAMLVEAVARLVPQFPQVRLDIYGAGALKETLQEQIASLHLEDVVTLQGNVTDLHSRIATARMFVLCSEFEGLSNALIEAMMLGLPCISTDYPGASELVQEGVNGCLVPCKDVAALTDAMASLLSQEDVAAQLGKQALQASKQYEKDVVLTQWINIINKPGVKE